ncbi:MAG TPA: sialidase family protein [Candidatus Thermoplasmatota archaeon]|nr:sialidase family protein [Candidatus Thermoplasmatota archaeon]
MARRLLPLALALLLPLPLAAYAAPAIAAISFVHYPVPTTTFAGETNIGVNPRTDNVFFQLTNLRTYRAHFDDGTAPATVTWRLLGGLAQPLTLDPILWTDRTSGRTFVVQLAGAASYVWMTQDAPVLNDGEVWVPTDVPTSFPFFDHQSVGTGPHGTVPNPDTILNLPPPATGALNAMYYCGQLGIEVCARSDDDGLTWGPYVPINANNNCGGLSGQVRVDHIGTVYVPNKDCGTQQGAIISRTNGLLWGAWPIEGTDDGLSDPTIAIGNDNRAWIGMTSAGKPLVSWTDNIGVDWAAPVDVSAPFTVCNTRMPMMVAGDAGRAALAFYGTPTCGDDQDDEFTGEWHLYVSITLDGGATWSTVDTTPTDPVQRGCIWMNGGNNPCRNLLDFQGASLDSHGRILVGWADGCTSAACVAPTGQPGDSRASLGTVTRLQHGPSLYADEGEL